MAKPKIQVYDTLARALVPFKPKKRGEVSIYICGLTPYDHSHLGHARTYVAFDIIKRFLITQGYRLFTVQNVTDIDDKIISRAKQAGAIPLELASYFDILSRDDLTTLNCLPADVYPKVSGHIKEIDALIQSLLDKGYAYQTSTGIYYDTSKDAEYGKLSKQNKDDLTKSRLEPDETKRSQADFALWKFTVDEYYTFDSSFGKGRPGWHIECSAMAMKYLKTPIDIHAGALDLVFPHHENEIAQSEPLCGAFVKYWFHTGFLTVNGEKMAKSLGNFITIRDALKKFEPNVLRLFFSQTHYRSPLDYSEAAIDSNKAAYERICTAYTRILEAFSQLKPAAKPTGSFQRKIKALEKQFVSFMSNDFDAPNALTVLFTLITEANKHLDSNETEGLAEALYLFRKLLFVFGLSIPSASGAKTQGGGADAERFNSSIDLLMELRDKARAAKDYATSDQIRVKLGELGIEVQDTEGKSIWHPKQG